MKHLKKIWSSQSLNSILNIGLILNENSISIDLEDEIDWTIQTYIIRIVEQEISEATDYL